MSNNNIKSMLALKFATKNKKVYNSVIRVYMSTVVWTLFLSKNQGGKKSGTEPKSGGNSKCLDSNLPNGNVAMIRAFFASDN